MTVKGVGGAIINSQSTESASVNSNSTKVNSAANSTKVKVESRNTYNSENGSNNTETDMTRVKNAIDQVNHKLKATRTRCEFSYHEEVNRVSIKVLDKETDTVIREIPPEESLKALEKIWEIAGLLIDERR